MRCEITAPCSEFKFTTRQLTERFCTWPALVLNTQEVDVRRRVTTVVDIIVLVLVLDLKFYCDGGMEEFPISRHSTVFSVLAG